ncbi:hypothetical protein [Pseudomonas sp. RA_35y_Pfl2_P32]|uniref:hypothetical protein n=1 Tax=Pseudomonas sp. RA_35y_Pfl2_P32 TaxID=3088705 RepID=UPI0030D96184
MQLKLNRRFAKFLYFITGALTITTAQAEFPRPTTVQPTQIDSQHGFFSTQPWTLVPVMVCPPGTTLRALTTSHNCEETGSNIVRDAISPEKYLAQACPGAIMTSLMLNGWPYERVAIGFDLPTGGCQELKLKPSQ